MAKVLVVEDDVLHIILIREILSRVGHEVIGLNDTSDFIRIVAQTQPDIILMDLLLKKQHGFVLIRHLRQTPTLASIPVIVITATSLVGLPQRFANLNCLAYINKPLQVNLLRELIDSAVPATCS